MSHPFILTLSCHERPGIVHAVSGVPVRERLRHRRAPAVRRRRSRAPVPAHRVRLRRRDRRRATHRRLPPRRRAILDDVRSHLRGARARILVMVSKLGHCLNDLIFRWRGGNLGGELVAVVSNHEDLRPMAEAAGLPFLHMPVTPETKGPGRGAAARARGRVRGRSGRPGPLHAGPLATTCTALHGRAINIHHSFLPGFKGAKPYHQAYDRGSQTGRRHRPLRHARAGRRTDHRAGGHPDRPHL